MIKQEYKQKTGIHFLYYKGGVVVGPVVPTGFAVVGIDVGPLVLGFTVIDTV
jgi:hypothetical protein